MVTFQEKMEHLLQVTIIYVVQFIYSNYLPREDQLTEGGTSSQNVPYLYYGNSEKRNIQKFQKCTILDDWKWIQNTISFIPIPNIPALKLSSVNHFTPILLDDILWYVMVYILQTKLDYFS